MTIPDPKDLEELTWEQAEALFPGVTRLEPSGFTTQDGTPVLGVNDRGVLVYGINRYWAWCWDPYIQDWLAMEVHPDNIQYGQNVHP